MKYTGHHELSSLPIKKGDRVRVPKGVLVHTTHPSGPRVSARSQVITVHHLCTGSIAWDDHPAINPKVIWPGSGGYWREVDINDVEKVEDSQDDA